MRYLRVLAVLGICLIAASYANAQRVVVGVGFGAPAYVGPAPVCAYGYYPYYPYACAPYGYYGPEWFAGGVFIGAGPWFHGFYGRPWYHGFYGRPGFYGHSGFYGRPGPGYWHGPAPRVPAFSGHGPVGGFHGAPAFRGGGGFHGGGRR